MAMMSRVLVLAVAVVAATGCVTIRRHEVQDAEQVLAASGFHMKRANTPEKVADPRSVPPRRLLLPQERDGRLYYVYADPEVCRCLYVGTQAQYHEYRRLGLRKRIAEALMAAEQESLNAMTLDWGLWVDRGPGTDPAWPRPSAGWARTSRIAGGGP
jgi:hypothetical protein